MSTRVYVGNIPYDTRERDLESFFKSYGRIRDISLKNGYAFVDFDDYRDAEDAVYEMDGKKLLGRRVSVEAARGKPRGRDRELYGSSYSARGRNPPVRTNYRVFVENLSSTVSWQDLKDYLGSAGEVTFADAHKKYKNEGIAEFASYDDMKRAIKKFDDSLLNGRRIKLVEDKSSKKSYSRSRSRSRSRRSRSKSRNGEDKKSRSRSKSARKSEERKSRSRSASHKSEERRSRSKSPEETKKRSRSPRSGSESPVKKRRSESPARDQSRSRSPSN